MMEVEAAVVAPERDQRGEVAGERADHAQAGTNGDSPAATPDDQMVAPASARAVELESEHWRQRAIVWRERAMAAELVAKTLQRNLDDLRANLEDLRSQVELPSVDDAPRAAAIAGSEPPWRRFVRDLYDKYLA